MLEIVFGQGADANPNIARSDEIVSPDVTVRKRSLDLTDVDKVL